MSMRSIIEINHDLNPASDAEFARWALKMKVFLNSAQQGNLPYGVRLQAHVHHTDKLADGGIMKEIQLWRGAVQSLTPGGSEFGTPESVVAFVSEERTRRHQIRVESAQQKRQIAEVTRQRNELLKHLKHAVRWFDQITAQDAARFEATIASIEGKAAATVGGDDNSGMAP